jgi:DNA-binding NarL/FixJ family response regulator
VSADPAVRGRWRRALHKICTIHEESHRDRLVGALVKLKPEVLLLDCSVPNLRRAEDIATIQQASPGTAVLLLAQAPDESQAICALKASARGYHSVRISPTLLRRAIDKIQRGEIWAGRGVLSRLVTEFALDVRRQRLAATSASFGVLTPREREIAGMVMERCHQQGNRGAAERQGGHSQGEPGENLSQAGMLEPSTAGARRCRPATQPSVDRG